MVTRESTEQAENMPASLPEDFLPEVQEKFGGDLLVTPKGTEVLQRNPSFFSLLHGSLLKMENKISNAISMQGFRGKMFTELLEQGTSETTEVKGDAAMTISYLGKGTESWAFLITIEGEDEQFVVKLPTKPQYSDLISPVEQLRKENIKSPRYDRQLVATQAIATDYAEDLADANIRMPEYLMAGSFFSIMRYEGERTIQQAADAGQVSDRYIYKRKLVPAGAKIGLNVNFRGSIENEEKYKDIIVDWTVSKEDSFRVNDNGELSASTLSPSPDIFMHS